MDKALRSIRISPQRRVLMVEIALIFATAMLLILCAEMPGRIVRIGAVVVAGFCLALVRSRQLGYTREELGLADLKKHLTPWLAFIAVGVVFMAALGRITNSLPWLPPPNDITVTWYGAICYVTLSAGTQEFFFRGYLWTRIRNECSPALSIIIVSTIFALTHFFSLRSGTLLWLYAGLGGLALMVWYRRFPNLAGVSLAHGILGLCVFYLL